MIVYLLQKIRTRAICSSGLDFWCAYGTLLPTLLSLAEMLN